MSDHHSTIAVHLLPSLIAPGFLSGSIAVVVDVLRATSAMVQAISSGCRAIIPCLEIDDARAQAAQFEPGAVVLAGERRGIPVEGFDFGNSPGSFTCEVCEGKTLVMTTTNGTRAILASLGAERVLVGSFGNLDATVEAIAADGRPVHIICSGTDGLISWEDGLLAGAIVDRLLSRRGSDGDGGTRHSVQNDEAEIALGCWTRERLSADVEQTEILAAIMARGRGGKRVRELGYDADIVAASRMSWFPRILEVTRDPVRIVAGALNHDRSLGG